MRGENVLKIGEEKLKKYLDLFATLWIILSTGSVVFCIFHMEFSMIILDLTALLYLLREPKTGEKWVGITLILIVLVAANSLVNFRYFILHKDIVILLMRLFALMVICYNISKRVFMSNYCKILYYLCLLSLLCFGLSEMGVTLPGEYTVWFKDKYYILTFYHTIGRWDPFHRNAGIFWESPAFGIFITTAICFLMFGETDIQEKKKLKYLFVYSVTVFTTLSTLVFLEYMAVIAAIVFNRAGSARTMLDRKNDKLMKYAISGAVLVLIVALGLLEANLHIIEHKLINKQGSFNTRANDTLMTFQLLKDRWLTGYGMFNSFTLDALAALGVKDNSNGFALVYLYFGVPLATTYFGYFAYRLRKLFHCTRLSYLCILGAFFVFVNAEHITVMTLFLLYLFPMGDGQRRRTICEGMKEVEHEQEK